MIALTFEFDLVSPDTLAWFDQLPQALAGRSVVIDYRPVAPPAGHPALPWVQLLVACGAGRWACDQVLHRRGQEPLGAVSASLNLRNDWATALPPAPGGPVPAIVWDGRRFDGPDAIERLLAALAT